MKHPIIDEALPFDGIEICLGSSCFARGNGDLLSQVQEMLKEYGLDNAISIRGRLCADGCSKGPHVTIDGIAHVGLGTEKILDKIQGWCLEQIK